MKILSEPIDAIVKFTKEKNIRFRINFDTQIKNNAIMRFE